MNNRKIELVIDDDVIMEVEQPQPEQGFRFTSEAGLKMFVAGDESLQQMSAVLLPQILIDAMLYNVNTTITRSAGEPNMKFLSKKLFAENEMRSYLGIQLVAGIFRFPNTRMHWNTEDIFKLGVETLMVEGRFAYIDNNVTQDGDKLLPALSETRKKWGLIYQPGEALYLWKSDNFYYLFDMATQFLLDQCITDKKDGLLQMLQQYSYKNHILYLSFQIEVQIVEALILYKIYCIGYITAQLNNPNTRLRYLQLQDGLFVFPQTDPQLEDEVIGQNYYSTHQQRLPSMKIAVKELIIKSKSQDLKRILFEATIQGSIYNMYCLTHSILINESSDLQFKHLKIKLAAHLVGDKFRQLEFDRQKMLDKQIKIYVPNEMVTDKLGFGLLDSYHPNDYHQPCKVDDISKLKYCIVCMKYENLTKAYFNCLQCDKLFGTSVFLCTHPCFQFFHQNPGMYQSVDQRILALQQTEKYFKDNVVNSITDIEYRRDNDHKFTDIDKLRNELYQSRKQPQRREPSEPPISPRREPKTFHSNIHVLNGGQLPRVRAMDLKPSRKNDLFTSYGNEKNIEDILNKQQFAEGLLKRQPVMPELNYQISYAPVKYNTNIPSRVEQQEPQRTKRIRMQLPNTIRSQADMGREGTQNNDEELYDQRPPQSAKKNQSQQQNQNQVQSQEVKFKSPFEKFMNQNTKQES